MLDRRYAAEIFPLIMGTFIAMLPMEATPFVIGGLVQAGLSTEQAGWVGTTSIFAVALVSMFTPPLISRLPFRTTMIAFGLVTILAYAMLGATTSFTLLLLIGTLAGAGSGGLLAGMAMRVARTADPDRSYGYIYASTGVGFALLLLVLPIVGSRFGHAAMFVLIAAVGGLILPLLCRLPVDHVAQEETGATDGGICWPFVAIVVLVMTVAFPIYGGTYGFAERKAVEIGLSARQAGQVLAGATMLTIVGSAIVAFIGTRWGRLMPTVVVMLIATLAYYLVLGARSPAGYAAGMLLFGLMQLALNSYFFGLASALDRAGGVAATLQGFSLIPYALGSGLFGSLTGGGSLHMLALPAAGLNLAGLLILLPVLVALDRNMRRRRPE
ncbi:MFS transporter [Flavisphingomonas formosensis]|uniref:MFS transporter n=1 Tax=Flavisphingomonas formosensis TaxID=861534 RepID=UPI0012FCC762|nr:MFS transporter [Sphingomonas formosensis]